MHLATEYAALVRMEDRRECSDRKIVSRYRERARGVYYGAVFEVKKEIPVEARRNTIWEQMREIEGELFLLAARSGELDFVNGHRFKRLVPDTKSFRIEFSRKLLVLELGRVAAVVVVTS